MIIQFTQKKFKKRLAALLLLCMLSELMAPIPAYALTSGPAQPEYEKFQPIGTNEMVDPFTGDLKYNIPLLEIGGYPVNLVYSAGVGVEEEASWTGLGWNLNVGNINRVVRGVPDDFKGEEIIHKEYKKPRFIVKALFQNNGNLKTTLSTKEEKLFEIGPLKYTFSNSIKLGFNYGLGLTYDNYKGIGFIGNAALDLSQIREHNETLDNFIIDETTGGKTSQYISEHINEKSLFNFGLDYNSLEGTKLHGSSGRLRNGKWGERGNFLFTPSFEANSSSGLSNLGIKNGGSLTSKNEKLALGGSSNLPFLRSSPIQDFPSFYYTGSINFSQEISKPKGLLVDPRKYTIQGTAQIFALAVNTISRPAYGSFHQEDVYTKGINFSFISDFQREQRSYDDNSPLLPVSQKTPDVFIMNSQAGQGVYLANNKVHYFGQEPLQLSLSESVDLQFELGKKVGLEGGTSIGFGLGIEQKSGWGPLNDEVLGFYKQFFVISSPFDEAITENLAKGNMLRCAMGGTKDMVIPKISATRHYQELPYIMRSNGGFAGTSILIPSEIKNSDYIKPKLLRSIKSLSILAENKFVSSPATTTEITAPLVSKDRVAQNGAMLILTNEEASNYGIHKELKTFGLNTLLQDPGRYSYYDPNISNSTLNSSTVARIDNDKKSNQIGEIRVQQPGGGQLIYGQPVYILEQKDYRFNVGVYEASMNGNSAKNIRNYFTGIVSEIPSNHFNPSYIDANGKQNGQGVDGYFQEKSIPAHSENFLLTEVLSSDYVDNDGVAGPTENDLGGYVKFNYSYAGNQRWRTPYEDRSGYLQQNNKFDKEDDHAIFTEGVKELWYLHSIQSKTHIALFFTEARRDGRAAFVANSGNSNATARSRLLRRIEVYSLKEFNEKGQQAIPEKTVHFEYSYDLCPNVPNNPLESLANEYEHPLKNLTNTFGGQAYNRYENELRGKLTLHKVWFTHGSIQWESGGSYIFEYDMSKNYNYAPRALDMWGTYLDPEYYKKNLSDPSNELNIQDFPYTPQEYEKAKDFASAYKLKRIHLPSGGNITIDYEADDYAYVQNRKAQRLYPIVALGNDNEHTNKTIVAGANKLHNPSDHGVNPWIFVKTDGATNPADLLDDDDIVLFSAMVDLNHQNSFHTIQGYLEYSAGVATTSHKKDIAIYPNLGNGEEFAFRTIPISYKSKEVHPITKFSWQYIRDQVPYLMNPGSERKNRDRAGEIGNIMGSIFGFLDGASKIVKGEASVFLNKRFGIELDLNRSFVRLNEYTGYKFGGGYRVKRITISDNWNEMSGSEQTSEYATEYIYTTNRDGKIISSGVATMEPSGSRENPLKRPYSLPSPLATRRIRKGLAISLTQDVQNSGNNGIAKSNSGKLMTNTLSYDEGPIGEQFYPTPSVGYSRITIKSIGRTTTNNTKHGIGKMVLEFYTAKDFPVITIVDAMDTEKLRLSNLSPTLPFTHTNENTQGTESITKLSPDISYSNDMYGASQGFLIELNDMHGKPKAVYNYGENENQYASATFYRYHEKDNPDGTKSITNIVNVINSDGTKGTKELGVDIDISIDAYRIKSANTTAGINIDYDQQGTVPVTIVSPKMHYSKWESRIITFTKTVNRLGILKEIEQVDNENKIKTQNLAFDGETGAVLLSRAQNEFDDWVYSLTKPAYWIYKGLEGAWNNIDLMVELDLDGNGVAQDYSTILVTGDELIDLTDFQKYWVLHAGVDAGVIKVQIVDELGNPLTTTKHNFRLIRSGHRELVQAPAESISLMRNPLDFSNVYKSVPNAVLGAKAFEYFDNTQVYSNQNKCIYVKCSEPETGPISVSLGDEPDEGFTPYCFNSGTNKHYQIGDQVNPYFVGIKGIWRPSKEWNYYDRTNTTFAREQKQDNPYDPNTTNIRTAGTIAEYYPFWSQSGGNWVSSNTSQYWMASEWLTQTDNLGNTVESSNPLDIRSSALFGYKKMLATAVTSNSKYSEMLFDGFEDYEVNDVPWLGCFGSQVVMMNPNLINSEDNEMRHWPLWKALVDGSLKVTNSVSHTGWQSIKLDANKTATIPLDSKFTGFALNGDWLPHKLAESDFISNFLPSAKKYSISFWYKSEKNKFQFEILDPTGTALTLTPTDDNGKTVDGWKKAEYTFNVSVGAEKISFKFNNTSTSEPAFLDDFRVLPDKAIMKSFVYDKTRYKLMAALDENNYATFFEYNPDGSLARTKAETEKGIVTLNSGKSNIKK